jgi:hypothetical protein
MADVPTGSFIPTTTPTALPDNMQSIDATPDAFGAAGADAQAKLGAGLDQAGNDINTTGEQQLALLNQAKTTDAVNALQTTMNKELYGDPSDPSAPPGFLSLSGQNMMNAYGPMVQRIEAQRDQLAASLPMSVASSFNDDTRRLVNSTLSDAGGRVVDAQKQWAATSYSQALDTSTNTVLLNRDNPSMLNQSLAQRDTLIANRGQQLGLTPDQITAAQSNDRSTTLTQVIMAKAQQDPQVAYSFYQQNKGALTAADQLDIESKLRDPVNATAAGNDADTLAAGGTPATSPSSPVSPAQLAPAIVQEANAQGVDPKLALATAQVETGIGAHTSAPGSSATGVFGMEPPTFQDMGGGNANDVGTQVHHGVAYLKVAQQAADAAVGGTAQNWQTYAVYQQGTAGGRLRTTIRSKPWVRRC